MSCNAASVETERSDAVEDVELTATYYATVSRKTKDGSVFYPDQRMSRLEALKSYTLNGACGACEPSRKRRYEL